MCTSMVGLLMAADFHVPPTRTISTDPSEFVRHPKHDLAVATLYMVMARQRQGKSTMTTRSLNDTIGGQRHCNSRLVWGVIKTPPVDTSLFGFYMYERPICLVAIGRVHHGDSTLHCAYLQAHLVKVVVEEAVDGSAEVPIPTEEDIQRSKSYLVLQRLSLVSRYMCHGIQLPLVVVVMMFPSTYITMICWKSLKTSSGLAYRFYSFGLYKYLSKLNMGTMDEDLYEYFYPQSIQNMGNKGDVASEYITSRMSDVKKQIYLGAYQHDEHWQLLVVIPVKGEVVWFCSLHRKPDNRIKAVLHNVVTAVINKVEVGSVGITSCTGCRLFFELVLPMEMEMFDDVAVFSIDRIREIRTEWAKEFLEVRNRLYA
ncbi:hypothetical protein OROMI_003763 [Orobanche minor]